MEAGRYASRGMPTPSPTQRIQLRVFGAVELHGAPDGDDLLAQPKRLAVFLYLLLARPRGFHRRDRIVGLFWPELSETQARAALRKALHGIRRGIGEQALLSRGDDEIAIDGNDVWCDAIAFDDARENGRFAEMLELLRGELLGGFYPDAPGFERWLEEERARVRDEAGAAAWALAERYEKGADLTSATRWARKAAKYASGDERRIRKVMQLLHRAGDRAGAVAVYDAFVESLRREFEVAPSAETQALAKTIRGTAS